MPNDPGKHAADGTLRYQRAVLPARESFASKVKVGGYFLCSLTDSSDVETQEAVVLLDEMCVDSSGVCSVLVTPLDEEGIDAHHNRLLRLSDHKISLPPLTLCYPVHVVPNCALLSSACTIHSRAPQPHAFNFSCFGLDGGHTECKTYVLNSYLVK